MDQTDMMVRPTPSSAKGKGKEMPNSISRDGQTYAASRKPPHKTRPAKGLGPCSTPHSTLPRTLETPFQSKVDLDQHSHDRPTQRRSSSKRANDQSHDCSDGVSAPPSSPASRPSAATQKLRYTARSVPNPRPSTRHRVSRSRQKGHSAPASFEAVHVPSGSAYAHHSTQASRRQQPVREVKILRSIEHQVDPQDPTHSPYPWDDPLVSCLDPDRETSVSNNYRAHRGSPLHDRDTALTRRSSTGVSDIEDSPLQKPRMVHKKKESSDPANHEEHHQKQSSPLARMKRELTAALDLKSFQLQSAQTPIDGDEILPGNSTDFHGAEVKGLRREVARLTQLLNAQITLSETKQRDRDIWFREAIEILEKLKLARSTEPQEGSNTNERRCSAPFKTPTAPNAAPVTIRHPHICSDIARPDSTTSDVVRLPQSFQGVTSFPRQISNQTTTPEKSRTHKDARGKSTKRRKPLFSQHSSQTQLDGRPKPPPQKPRRSQQEKSKHMSDTPRSRLPPRAHGIPMKPDMTSPLLATHTRWLRCPGDGVLSENVNSSVPMPRGPPLEQRSRNPDTNAAAESSHGNATSTVVVHAVDKRPSSAKVNGNAAASQPHKDKQRKESKKQQDGATPSSFMKEKLSDQKNGADRRVPKEMVEGRTDSAQSLLGPTGSDSGYRRQVSRETSELPDLDTLLRNSQKTRTVDRSPVPQGPRSESIEQDGNGSPVKDIVEAESSNSTVGAPLSCSQIVSHETQQEMRETERSSYLADKSQQRVRSGSGNTIDDAFNFASDFLSEPAQHWPSTRDHSHGTIPSHVFYRKDPPRPETRPPPSLKLHSDDANSHQSPEPHPTKVDVNAKRCPAELPQRVAKKPRTTQGSGDRTQNDRLIHASTKQQLPSGTPCRSPKRIAKPLENKQSPLAFRTRNDPEHRLETQRQSHLHDPCETQPGVAKRKRADVHRDNGCRPLAVDSSVGSTRLPQGKDPKTLQTPDQSDQDSYLDAPSTPEPRPKSIHRRHGAEPMRSPELSSPAAAVKQATAKLSTLELFTSTGTTLSQPHEPLTAIEGTHAPLWGVAAQQSRYRKAPVPQEQPHKSKSARGGMERKVPHQQRTSDEELVRIGRYQSVRARHLSAPYAFSSSGKLFHEYNYLVNRTDTYGEGWDKALQKKLVRISKN
ncbi:MAG: hypothetical protein Q9216_002362 [Gyalolechia sp. 2 TL-2023]